MLESWNKCIPCGTTSESSWLEARLECLECLSLIVLASFFASLRGHSETLVCIR